MLLHISQIGLLFSLCIFITETKQLDLNCGVRPPKPLSNPWDTPKYGPYGWDNPQLARRHDFPWQVGVFRRSSGAFVYECGGSLISGGSSENQVLILTGARCVSKSLNSSEAETWLENFRVVIGPHSSNYNKNNDEFGAQKFKISKIEIHPLYEAKNRDSDIAILQLSGNVHLGPLALPVCLPPNNAEKNGVAFGMVGEIAGFGWDTRRNVTEMLRYARYPIVLSKTCQDKLGVKVNDYLEFCTSYEKDSTACQGDYGGGIVFQQPKVKGFEGRFFLQGFLSNLDATPVTDEGYCENYNVFKRIGPYLEWIKETQVKLASEDVQSVPKPKPTSGFPLGNVPEFAKIARDLHNHYRLAHKVPSVRLVGKIQQEAQRLSEELVEEDTLELPDSDKYPYSTNVYVIPKLVNARDAVRDAVQHWYRGFALYDRNDPQPSAFTQMIWRSSTQIGVGVATDGEKTVVVTNYWPRGNILLKGGKKHERVKSFYENVRVIQAHP